jgi:hypothetical protein
MGFDIGFCALRAVQYSGVDLLPVWPGPPSTAVTRDFKRCRKNRGIHYQDKRSVDGHTWASIGYASIIMSPHYFVCFTAIEGIKKELSADGSKALPAGGSTLKLDFRKLGRNWSF